MRVAKVHPRSFSYGFKAFKHLDTTSVIIIAHGITIFWLETGCCGPFWNQKLPAFLLQNLLLVTGYKDTPFYDGEIVVLRTIFQHPAPLYQKRVDIARSKVEIDQKPNVLERRRWRGDA